MLGFTVMYYDNTSGSEIELYKVTLNKSTNTAHVQNLCGARHIKVIELCTNTTNKDSLNYDIPLHKALAFLQTRIFPKTRINIDKALQKLNIQEYDPFELIKINHGRLKIDNIWVKQINEDISYADIGETDQKHTGIDTRGNQTKFWYKDSLIKVDSEYREATKEQDASIIANSFGLNAVTYQIINKNMSSNHKACICNTFLKPYESTITLGNILDFYETHVENNMSASDYFNVACECIYKYTGLDARQYLLSMLVFDFLIANPDRHLSNIEFIQGNGYFRPAPIFDNGQAFFKSDANMTNSQLEQAYRKFKTMPFSRKPKSNLIDIQMAQSIANQYRIASSNFNFNTSESRKQVVRFMYKKLIGM